MAKVCRIGKHDLKFRRFCTSWNIWYPTADADELVADIDIQWVYVLSCGIRPFVPKIIQKESVYESMLIFVVDSINVINYQTALLWGKSISEKVTRMPTVLQREIFVLGLWITSTYPKQLSRVIELEPKYLSPYLRIMTGRCKPTEINNYPDWVSIDT